MPTPVVGPAGTQPPIPPAALAITTTPEPLPFPEEVPIASPVSEPERLEIFDTSIAFSFLDDSLFIGECSSPNWGEDQDDAEKAPDDINYLD